MNYKLKIAGRRNKMSIIHVNHIKNHLIDTFTDIIDLSDVSVTCDPNQRQNFFLTRALAAYSILYLADITPEIAGQSVTDGSLDNGIDAVFYDDRKKIFYIAQSKWIHDGTGEPENGDVKKFISGIKDLFNLSLDRFNNKVKVKEESIKKALEDPNTMFEIILVYSGINNLSELSNRDFADFISEINDASDVVHLSVLNQKPLHTSLTSGVSGKPIDLTIGIKHWGLVQEPFKAYYGQINGSEISAWWDQFRTRLFAKNIRDLLGDTEVNQEIEKTLKVAPDNFWYFNNGITIVCDQVDKTMFGGADRDSGQFVCKSISIVNGAQTVGTIGRFGEKNKEPLEKVFIPIRIISLKESNDHFGETITKSNNRQNKIENRDFVSLDPEQARIQMELAIDKVKYHIVRSESVKRNDQSFDLVESTTALACASGDVQIAVQLKREIGRLWEDIGKTPYKKLFNPSVSGPFVWLCVKTQRQIDKQIEILAGNMGTNRDYSIAIHGNRIISLLIFSEINAAELKKPEFKFEVHCSDSVIENLVNKYYFLLRTKIESYYAGSVIPTLFKNQSKCVDLVYKIQTKLQDQKITSVESA